MKKNIPENSPEKAIAEFKTAVDAMVAEYAATKGITIEEFATEAEERLRSGEIARYLKNEKSGKEFEIVLPIDFVNLANSYLT